MPEYTFLVRRPARQMQTPGSAAPKYNHIHEAGKELLEAWAGHRYSTWPPNSSALVKGYGGKADRRRLGIVSRGCKG